MDPSFMMSKNPQKGMQDDTNCRGGFVPPTTTTTLFSLGHSASKHAFKVAALFGKERPYFKSSSH
jgi:hypothetical protein